MSDDLARRAARIGLRYMEAEKLCLKREKGPRGFRYLNARGRSIRNPKVLDRIRQLAIPPAWVEVCIADDAKAHLQAIGRDSEGRLQYRYHNDWTRVRDKVKAERLLRFGQALPRIRARLEEDLRRRTTDRRYAAATAARLIDRALLRSGHDVADPEKGGRGVATLLKRDVQLNGSTVVLNFVGKGGKTIQKTIRDPTLLARLKKLKQIGKRRLFVFRDDKGRRHRLTARDLNDYLREAAGDAVTAKDFRTFGASARALAALCETERPDSDAACRRAVKAIMRETAQRLVNTPAVTRSSYVHPTIVEAFEADRLTPAILRTNARNGLNHAESALMRFLEETVAIAASVPPPARNGRKPPATKQRRTIAKQLRKKRKDASAPRRAAAP